MIFFFWCVLDFHALCARILFVGARMLFSLTPEERKEFFFFFNPHTHTHTHTTHQSLVLAHTNIRTHSLYFSLSRNTQFFADVPPYTHHLSPSKYTKICTYIHKNIYVYLKICIHIQEPTARTKHMANCNTRHYVKTCKHVFRVQTLRSYVLTKYIFHDRNTFFTTEIHFSNVLRVRRYVSCEDFSHPMCIMFECTHEPHFPKMMSCVCEKVCFV